jgi:hypothetical protein
MSSQPSPVVQSAVCWWCGAPADSREHKFKRSDLVREHGVAPYNDGATLSIVGSGGSRYVRSNRSDPLKFSPSLCQPCNNTRSQAHDRAYDRFIEWVLAHEDDVLRTRQVDLEAVFGSTWSADSLDVLRYFAKHVGCRLAEIIQAGYPFAIPGDLIEFLDGGPRPASLRCDLYAEAAMIRWRDMRPNDPLWAPRPLWIEAVLGPEVSGLDILQSRWHYGWLTLTWAVGPDADASDVFGCRKLDVPLVAVAFDPGVELVFAAGHHGLLEDDPPPTSTDAPPLTGMGSSPVLRAMIAGALDLEAASREHGPDERHNMIAADPSAVDPEREMLRLRALLSICAAWAQGDLNEQTISKAAKSPVSGDPWALVASAEATQARVPSLESPYARIATHFASLAHLHLARAIELGGAGTPLGQEQALEAARHAGCTAAAAALARQEVGEAFSAVLVAARTLLNNASD